MIGIEKHYLKNIPVRAYQTDRDVIIHTLEGDMLARAGDYIITGIDGEQYPCKNDIFLRTYKEIQS